MRKVEPSDRQTDRERERERGLTTTCHTRGMPHETHYDCQVGLSRRRLSSMCAGRGRQPEASSHIATAAALITAPAAAAAWQIITIERDADSAETVQRETETETATGDGGADSAQKSMTSLWHAASAPLPAQPLCMCIKSAGSWK